MKRIKVTDKYYIGMEKVDGFIEYHVLEFVDGNYKVICEHEDFFELRFAIDDIAIRMTMDSFENQEDVDLEMYFCRYQQIKRGIEIRIGNVSYRNMDRYETNKIVNVPSYFTDENITYSDNSKNTFIDNVGVFDNRKK